MRKLKIPLAFVLLVLLSACQTLGVPQADTFNKRVIVANSIVEQSANTVSTLVSAGRLSHEDAQRSLDRVRDAAAGIDVARQVLPDDPAAADAKLSAVIAALNALNLYLESQK